MNLNNNSKFSRCLNDLLSASGAERGELARRLGVSVPVVNRWLNGSAAPDVQQLQAVAAFFQTPCGWFLEDGIPDVTGMAGTLGLSPETVEDLICLAEDRDGKSAMEAVDKTVRAAVSVVSGVYEDLDRYAGETIERMERGEFAE